MKKNEESLLKLKHEVTILKKIVYIDQCNFMGKEREK